MDGDKIAWDTWQAWEARKPAQEPISPIIGAVIKSGIRILRIAGHGVNSGFDREALQWIIISAVPNAENSYNRLWPLPSMLVVYT
jgi:P pilus assembly chaperone PapD